MTSFDFRRLTRGAGLLAAAFALAPGPILAQATPPGFVSFPEDPGATLSRHLVTIASDPNDLAALKGAGEAALELGDPQAALGFLARAEEVSPRDGQVKALMGSALLAMEQVRPALRFFDDAKALGFPEANFAGDRGLAYDLIGNPRLAQRDYQEALKRKEDPEVRRRLALSLAISGERDAALQTIDAQLRQQDRAAWRVRAFVLALSGDLEGASNAVRAVMAPPVAAAMRPFLARLPSLDVADRAFAVHFGRFPEGSSGATASAAGASSTNSPLAGALAAGAPDRTQRPLGGAVASPAPATQPPAAAAPSQPAQHGDVRTSLNATAPPALTRPPAGQSILSTTVKQQQPLAPAGIRAEAVSTPLPQTALPGAAAAALSPRSSEPQAPGSGFSDVAAMVVLLPASEDAPAARQEAGSAPSARTRADAVPAPPPAAAPKPAAPKPAPKKPSPPKEPSRIWVQVAGGANKESLPREFARLKTKAPTLFAGKTAWTTTLRATNRLLVGPFKTDKEAQEFVNQLARAQLAGFAWTSEEGQTIERLPAR